MCAEGDVRQVRIVDTAKSSAAGAAIGTAIGAGLGAGLESTAKSERRQRLAASRPWIVWLSDWDGIARTHPFVKGKKVYVVP